MSHDKLEDLIDSLEISNDEVSHEQRNFLYKSEANNEYWIDLDVSDYSITEFKNRRKCDENYKGRNNPDKGKREEPTT